MIWGYHYFWKHPYLTCQPKRWTAFFPVSGEMLPPSHNANHHRDDITSVDSGNTLPHFHLFLSMSPMILLGKAPKWQLLSIVIKLTQLQQQQQLQKIDNNNNLTITTTTWASQREFCLLLGNLITAPGPTFPWEESPRVERPWDISCQSPV